MNPLTKQFSINTFWLVTYILLSSLFVSENVFSRNHWNRNFTELTYDRYENSISIKFLVIDYFFGPSSETGYLKFCNFYFTHNRTDYDLLMRVEAKDQKLSSFTEFKMSNKNTSAELQFLGCVKPINRSIWFDSIEEVTVEVKNEVYGQQSSILNDKIITFNKYNASFTIKWFLGENFDGVRYIRLNGVWNVTGLGNDQIKDVHYRILRRMMLKSTDDQLENNRVKVAAKADAIFITGVENGENIKVYNVTGVMVQSTVTNSDVVNIKLPKNQIYIVKIGEACHKIAF